MQQNASLARYIALGCLVAASAQLDLIVHGQDAVPRVAPPERTLLQLPTFEPEQSSAPERAAASADKDALDSYVGPTPIDRVAPDYPIDLIAAGRDGWVALSFVISAQGRVTDAMVEDSSGLRGLETAALKAIQKWRYRPATLNGMPVAQTMTRTLIRFQLNSDVHGATQAFRSTYIKTSQMIQKHDFEHARAMLDELEAAGRLNLYEDAWFWWLKYAYMETAGDASEEDRRDTLHRAIGYELDYLPADIFVAACERLFGLEAAASNLAGALDAVIRLKSSKTAKQSKSYPEVISALDAASAKIRALIDGDATLKVTGKVGNHDYWVHGLLRESFSIAEINGRIDEIEIRCTRGLTRYATAAVEQRLDVPPAWGSCGAYIKGEPGTTFVVYEYPKKS